jgi:hypothetical protein
MFKELGYYSCDGKIFETKLEAMLYADPKNLSIDWHFNNEIFDNYNWTIEPELSLDELYDRRARQIREQYDYVILSYSGGADSNNILESFLRQGLHIDEIMTNWALDANDRYIVKDTSVKDSWNTNAEFYLHTASRLDYIRNKSPRTKISLVDSSRSIIDSLLNNSNADWVYGKNDVFNVTGAFQFNPVYHSKVRKRFDGLQNVAYVLGIDKPKLMIINNQFYLYFVDKTTNIVPVKENIVQYNNITPVFFYWSSECCQLLAKQAHTVYKYLQVTPAARQIWESRDAKVLRRVQEGLLRSIIYSTWNTNWFQVMKPTQDWNSELDDWFTKGWAGTTEHAIWKEGLEVLTPLISNFIKYDNGQLVGTKPCFSKFYRIGGFDGLII